MKDDVLRVIRAKTRAHSGIRTTEVYEFLEALEMEDTFENRDAVKEAIEELVADGKIKCVTEEWEDYCWLVPADWEDRPVPGYIHVPKKGCEIFGL